MVTKEYIRDFYKQFEELSIKLDKANNTISHMTMTISTRAYEIKN